MDALPVEASRIHGSFLAGCRRAALVVLLASVAPGCGSCGGSSTPVSGGGGGEGGPVLLYMDSDAGRRTYDVRPRRHPILDTLDAGAPR
jgi:hypothetical protein